MEHNSTQTVQDVEQLFPQISGDIPLLPLRNAVLYPYIAMPVVVNGADSIRLIEEVIADQKIMGVVAQRSSDVNSPKADDLFSVGTLVKIVKTFKADKGGLHVLLQGLSRMKIVDYAQESPHYIAHVEILRDVVQADKEISAMMSNVKSLIVSVVQLGYNIPEELQLVLSNVDTPGILADMIAETPGFSLQERQELLEMTDVKQRLHHVIVLLTREQEQLKLRQKIQNQAQNTMDKTQREYYLREQLKAIRKELGEDVEQGDEQDELRKRIEDTKMPEEVRETAEKEFDRLSKMHPSSAEYTVSQTYLDWILDLPWEISTEDNLELAKAEEVLEEDHYGLGKVKKRILEYLAVQQLTNESKGPILCLVGPPGVGKTSLGRSIARALNRKFVRISLGGIRDEAEIRGHRRTYVGALPGRIIQGIKKAGSNNPIVMLDEVDKVGTDFRGDPASALLEVLDPEQNNSFSDHYLELPFDLSKVMFITTANVLSTIPGSLLDRMEVINIAGYTEEEKIKIAQQYLVPRQLQANGVKAEQLTIDESALQAVIHSYTREAGLRNLEREIGAICRGMAKEIVAGQVESVMVAAESVASYLGPIRFFSEVAERAAQPGVVTGLAWTPVGGDVLFVEATKMKGHERLILTGQLGNVMKESAEIALSYTRAKADELGLPEDFNKNTDVHVHVPSGAIPKDGPSAGVTLYTSLVSLFTDKPVRSDVAMTGEVTLRGSVLPVGGIKAKVLAARSAGVKHVILPAQNEKDMDDIPENVKQELSFHFVKNMDEVLQFALKNSN